MTRKTPLYEETDVVNMFLRSLRTFFIILSFALPNLISFAHTFVLKPSVSQALAKVLIGNILIQTEAERRRREAGVQQSIENGLGSCMYVYMFVCMGFANIWRFKALSESKVVPYNSHVNSTFFRHVFSAVVNPEEHGT